MTVFTKQGNFYIYFERYRINDYICNPKCPDGELACRQTGLVTVAAIRK